MALEKFFFPVCCVEWHGEQLSFQNWPRIYYHLSYRIFWSAMAKFNIMPLYTLFFLKSYLPVCAHSRRSSGTKVDQLEELYKILLKISILTHIMLVNAVRTKQYAIKTRKVRISTKIDIQKFLFYWLIIYGLSAVQWKIIIRFGPEIAKIRIFSDMRYVKTWN